MYFFRKVGGKGIQQGQESIIVLNVHHIRGGHGIGAFHHFRDGGVEGHAIDVLRHFFNGFVQFLAYGKHPGFRSVLHQFGVDFPFSFLIFPEGHAPDAGQEAGNAFHTFGCPGFHVLERAHEHFI